MSKYQSAPKTAKGKTRSKHLRYFPIIKTVLFHRRASVQLLSGEQDPSERVRPMAPFFNYLMGYRRSLDRHSCFDTKEKGYSCIPITVSSINFVKNGLNVKINCGTNWHS